MRLSAVVQMSAALCTEARSVDSITAFFDFFSEPEKFHIVLPHGVTTLGRFSVAKEKLHPAFRSHLASVATVVAGPHKETLSCVR